MNPFNTEDVKTDQNFNTKKYYREEEEVQNTINIVYFVKQVKQS